MSDRTVNRAALLGLALLGLVLQSHAAEPAAYLGDTDAAKYLALARDAPHHSLFDGRMYVMHPPLYPWLIALVALLPGVSILSAGVLVSSLANVGLVLVTFGLARRFLPLNASILAALLLLATRATGVLGVGVWREPVQTLLVYALLWVVLEDKRKGLAVGLAVALGLTWDVFVLAVPLFVLAGWLLERRLLFVVAAALLLTWSAWAGVRYQAMTAAPTYPAGIDGLEEDTTAVSVQAAFNPNFLPRTAAHNAHFWRWQPTLARPFQLAAPWFAQREGTVLTPPAVSTLTNLGAALVLALCVAGGALFLRRSAERRGVRDLLLVAAVALLLGWPAFFGKQARYGHALLPLFAILSGRAFAAVVPRGRWPRVLAVGLLAVAWIWTRPYSTWTRPHYVQGRSVLNLHGDVVAAPVGLTPELCWLFPDKRVVTIPAEGVGALERLRARGVELLVVPHEQGVWDPWGDREAAELAHGVPALRAIFDAGRRGEIAHVGRAIEAELTDDLRVRVFDLFWITDSPAPKVAVYIAPGSIELLERAAWSWKATPETIRVLRQHGLVQGAR